MFQSSTSPSLLLPLGMSSEPYYEQFTSSQKIILETTVTITGTLSVLACLFVIWVYVRFRDLWRVFHLRLILALSVTDFFCSLVLVVGAITRDWSESGGDETMPEYIFCIIIGCLVQFFLLAGVLWTMCIAHTMFMVLATQDYHPERFEKFYHLLCWVVPTIFVLIIIVTDSVGDSGLWCWIRGDQSHERYRYLLLYFPLIMVIVINTVLYLSTYYHIWRDRRKFTPRLARRAEDSSMLYNTERSNPHSLQISFGYFIGVMLVCWVFPMLNGMLHTIDPDTRYFGIVFMNAFLLPLQGFLNTIVYGLNDEVRGRLVEHFPFFESLGELIGTVRRCICCSKVRRWFGHSMDELGGTPTQNSAQRKQWYDSIMTEYDEAPERRPENEEVAQAILSRGSIVSGEYDEILRSQGRRQPYMAMPIDIVTDDESSNFQDSDRVRAGKLSTSF